METYRTTGGVVWKFFKRTIDITDYRNAKDDVNRARNDTFGGIIHDWFVNLFFGGPRHLLWPNEKPASNAVCPTPNKPGFLSRPAWGPRPKRNRTGVELEECHLHSCQTSPPPG